MRTDSAMPPLAQDFLTSTWQAMAATRQMAGVFDAPDEPDAKLMVSAFGTLLEQELFVQRLDGDTMFDDAKAQSVAYRRARSTPAGPWSAWTLAS